MFDFEHLAALQVGSPGGPYRLFLTGCVLGEGMTSISPSRIKCNHAGVVMELA